MWDGKSKDPKVPVDVLLEVKIEPASQRRLKLYCGEAGSETSQAFPLASSASPSASSQWQHMQTEFTNYESWHFSFLLSVQLPTCFPLLCFPLTQSPHSSLCHCCSHPGSPSEPLTQTLPHCTSFALAINILLILALPCLRKTVLTYYTAL